MLNTIVIIWLESKTLPFQLEEHDMPTLTVDLDDLQDVQAAIPILNAIVSQPRGTSPVAVELEAQDPPSDAETTTGRDYTKYDVSIGQRTHHRLNKRHAAFVVVKYICDQQVATPQEIEELCRRRGSDGSDPVRDSKMFELAEIARKRPTRFFLRNDELIQCNGKTYAVSNQWGRSTLPVIQRLRDEFPDLGISATPSP
jgi:hypothetical protein